MSEGIQTMEKINFGFGIHMPVQPDKRTRAEEFLGNTLGCAEITRTEEYTCFRFPNGQIIGITPDKGAPFEEEYERSLWLEIISNDYEATKRRIQEFGVKEVVGGMPNAFFFHLPGGAVFRLVSEEVAAAGN